MPQHSDTPCATIQRAVDAVTANPGCAGDTVNVAAGMYMEQVTIPTALNLVGAGAGMTIIKAPATLATPNIDIVAIQAGATVLMSGFTVSGPLVNAGCGTLGAGIDVLPDATATIHDNTIAELRHEPLDGAARRWSRSRDV